LVLTISPSPAIIQRPSRSASVVAKPIRDAGVIAIGEVPLAAPAKALGDQSPALQDPTGSLGKSGNYLRRALDIAYAVGAKAQEEGRRKCVDLEIIFGS
jgi:hypothetical protein